MMSIVYLLLTSINNSYEAKKKDTKCKLKGSPPNPTETILARLEMRPAGSCRARAESDHLEKGSDVVLHAVLKDADGA